MIFPGLGKKWNSTTFPGFPMTGYTLSHVCGWLTKNNLLLLIKNNSFAMELHTDMPKSVRITISWQRHHTFACDGRIILYTASVH